MSVFFIDGFFYHSYKGLLTLYFVPNTYIYVGSSIFRLKMNNNNIHRIFQICTEQGTCLLESYEKGILALNSHGSCVINSIMNLLT